MTMYNGEGLRMDSDETTKMAQGKVVREKNHRQGGRDRFVVKEEVKQQEIVLFPVPLKKPLVWVE